jgi:DNA polymerase-3 subunit alpha/error-prone DNA polymerase
MIPLGVHSYYSLLQGTASPAELVRAARTRGWTRLALTDCDNLYGLWPFLATCRQEGVSPIVGAELTDPSAKISLTALVENDEGFRNLCALISHRKMNKDFNLPTEATAHSAGLFFLTEDPGLLEHLHAAGADLAACVPGQVTDHTLRLAALARSLEVPLVALTGNLFLNPADFALHRLLRAIAGNTSLTRLKPSDLAHPLAYLATSAEYAQRFETLPGALEATHAVAARCTFTGPKQDHVLPPWVDVAGRTAADVLRQAAYAGACGRYGEDLSETAVERLEHELRLIEQKNFSSYFLVVQDIIQRSPRICGRGSGAASLVAYCLGITNVCPLKHNLYFERFLNPGRTDPPDIDVDFAWDERDDLQQGVLSQYAGRAALVCNHVCFQPRMAIREVAKVYGLTESEIGQLVKRLPWFWHDDEPESGLQARLESLPELKHLDFPHPWPEILALAQKLIGLPRYISVHSGGIVITPGPITNYSPIERAPKGVPVLQWEKDGTEDAGLVKIDLLGNRSLGVIRDALANLHANGCVLDESRWEPEDDPATQQAVAAGKTMGCFYIESPAMRLLQQKTGVGDFEHLVIHSSIIRPAANEFIREYVRRLKGGAWEPLHPLLANVLDETFGIMVYQEDVSKAAMALAGFSHAQADGLRKILNKKDRELRLRDYREKFCAGARANGVDAAQIEAVWNMMLSFDGYSFCKPHSASYARVSFQAAYLKVHFPAEFMAAVISNQGGFYSAFAYVSESRRLGIKILPPDVNTSEIRWQGREREMRVGWLALKDLGAGTQLRIVTERRQKPFTHFREFLDRVAPDREEGRALIFSGTCDAVSNGQDRAALLWDFSAWQQQRGNHPGAHQNLDLFPQAADTTAPKIPPGQEIEQLRQEFKVLGFLCDRHPMELYAPALARRRVTKARDLERHVGQRVRLAGLLITGKVVSTRQGEPMEFITFEDETGTVETTFFPEAYRRFCGQLSRERPFLLTGKVEADFGAVTLTVEQVEKL